MLDRRDKEAFVRDLCELVRVPSRSFPEGGEEGAVQRSMAEKMAALGARVRTFEAKDTPGFFEHPLCCGPERDYADRPSVIGEVGPEDAPALLVLAHSDTVPIFRPEAWRRDPFLGEVVNGAVYGRGAGDDKWGMATMLAMLRALKGRDLRRRVIFASTIDEESGVGNGVLLLMLAGVEAEASLYLDGGEFNVCVGNMGGSNLYLTPGGPLAAEMWRRHGDALRELAGELSAERASRFDRPYFDTNPVRKASVRLFERETAGRRVWLLPFYTLPGEEREPLVAMLLGAVDEALDGDFALYGTSFREPWFEPSFSGPDAPMASLLRSAGLDLTFLNLGITTSSKQDSFVLNNHAHIPNVSFGPTIQAGPGAFHEPNEFMPVDRAWLGARIAAEAVRRWLEEDANA